MHLFALCSPGPGCSLLAEPGSAAPGTVCPQGPAGGGPPKSRTGAEQQQSSRWAQQPPVWLPSLVPRDQP